MIDKNFYRIVCFQSLVIRIFQTWVLNLIRILSEKFEYIVFNELVNGNAEHFKLKKVYTKDLYQVQETLKKLCEFSTVLADQADLACQKLFSKLTTISPRKTCDNFQIDTQKITQIRKKWTPSFSNQKKRNVDFYSMFKKTHGFESLNIFS